MEKINIAKLLEDCPSGMELDSPMFENLEFDRIDKGNGAYSIICRVKTEWGCYNTHTFTEYGCYRTEKYSKCVIFPKGKTTWDGFHKSFKDGDIVATDTGNWIGITLGGIYCESMPVYCVIDNHNNLRLYFDKPKNWYFSRLATKEEKQKLFNTIKANGYKWNTETKTLEKLLEFKDGDIIFKNNFIAIVAYIEPNGRIWYHCWYNTLSKKCKIKYDCGIGCIHDEEDKIRLAKEEEKQMLFDVIQANGYCWNEKTKSLEILPEFNDGDIISTEIGSIFIYNKSLNSQDYFGCYVGLSCIKSKNPKITIMDEFVVKTSNLHLATEEEKVKLFDAIKENGYRWNEETKLLDKLPKFKVGDRVVKKEGISIPVLITSVGDEYYYSNMGNSIGFFRVKEQDDWELVPDKFDLSTLKPFESKVLIRDYNDKPWVPSFWGKYIEDYSICKYLTTNGYYKYCIPYEGNEHLLDNTADCDNFYKTWE